MKGEGGGGGVPNPISQEIVFFQIPQSQPVLLKLKSQSHFSIVFFFMNPSPSVQNPISQPLKKANTSSHFTPSRPSAKNLPRDVKRSVMRIIVLPAGRCRFLEENESGLRFRRDKIWRFTEYTTPYNRPSPYSVLAAFLEQSPFLFNIQ